MAVAPGGGGGFRGGGVAVAPAAVAASGLAPLPAQAWVKAASRAASIKAAAAAITAAAIAITTVAAASGRASRSARIGIGSSYGYYGSPSYYDDSYGYYDDGVVAAAPPADDDAVAYCMQRYRSYDPASGTYLGNDGLAASLPGAVARCHEFEGRRISVRRPFRCKITRAAPPQRRRA